MPDDGAERGASANRAVISSTELGALFVSGADLGHCVFVDARLEGLVARQSIFPGAIFRNCSISGCDFSRSDFEGVRFEMCSISETSFENCDVRSTLFAGCRVQDCSFRGAYFSENTVQAGYLKTTDFAGATVTSNQFVSVQIVGINNVQATLLHNDFLSCGLIDLKLGDCTALYSYFRDCRFKGFKINADSLGLTFGLTVGDLNSAGLIFLGQKLEKPIDAELLEQIIAEFDRRGWRLHSAIAKLNFGEVSALDGWMEIFDGLRSALVEGETRLDDVTFVLHISEQLSAVDQLPFYPVVRAHDAFADVQFDAEHISPQHRALQRMRLGLVALIGNMQERYLAGAMEFADARISSPAIIEFVFSERPEIQPNEYVNYVTKVVGAESPLVSLGGRSGSWYEIVQGTVLTAVAIYTTLFLIEGSLIRLLLIKARLNQMSSPKLPKKFIDRANDPRQVLPRELFRVMKPLIELLSKGSMRLPSNRTGLTRKNLREIVVNTSDD